MNGGNLARLHLFMMSVQSLVYLAIYQTDAIMEFLLFLSIDVWDSARFTTKQILLQVGILGQWEVGKLSASTKNSALMWLYGGGHFAINASYRCKKTACVNIYKRRAPASINPLMEAAALRRPPPLTD
jgi:hypothetical protein